MQNGQTREMAQRWRVLVELDPRVKTIADLTCVFARHTGCEALYTKQMEGIVLKTSPFMDEVRIEVAQQYTRDILESRFPGLVPAAIVARIDAEKDLSRLNRWHLLSATATLEQFLKEM